MKKRDKYILASERIVTYKNRVCCAAIKDVGLEKSNFVKLFKPHKIAVRDKWFGESYIEENQLARSLALLFMAELDK